MSWTGDEGERGVLFGLAQERVGGEGGRWTNLQRLLRGLWKQERYIVGGADLFGGDPAVRRQTGGDEGNGSIGARTEDVFRDHFSVDRSREVEGEAHVFVGGCNYVVERFLYIFLFCWHW